MTMTFALGVAIGIVVGIAVGVPAGVGFAILTMAVGGKQR